MKTKALKTTRKVLKQMIKSAETKNQSATVNMRRRTACMFARLTGTDWSSSAVGQHFQLYGLNDYFEDHIRNLFLHSDYLWDGNASKVKISRWVKEAKKVKKLFSKEINKRKAAKAVN